MLASGTVGSKTQAVRIPFEDEEENLRAQRVFRLLQGRIGNDRAPHLR